jgi:formylglycine-generating enzyme required for sulfatase activity
MNDIKRMRFGLAILFISMILSGCGISSEERAATAAVLTAAAYTSTPTYTPSPTPLPKPVIGSVLQSEVDGMMMVFIPQGTFLQGSSEEEIDQAFEECQAFYKDCIREYFESEYPQHEVHLDSYWMDQTEVTIEMYKQCVSDGNCSPPVPRAYYEYSRYLDDPSHAEFPVIYVSWQQAQDYCTWAGRRLPTESEWEMAARSPNRWIYPWGNTSVRGELLNYRDINFAGILIDLSADDGYKRLAPVGSYPEGASLYGVMDLAGNVEEWVSDWYDVFPGGNPDVSDDYGQSVRVIRGGSWVSFFSELRSSYRMFADPDARGGTLGFRCALSHTEEVVSLFSEQQVNEPISTMVPMQTAESISSTAEAAGATSPPKGKCSITSISAITGFVSVLTGEEMPIYMYAAEGFSPSEDITVKLTGRITYSGLSLLTDVADWVNANGKGMVDGLLVWSSGLVGASTPSKFEISLEADGCSLKQSVTWPYSD